MDLLCYSHLRWNFVYQRPQHLMSRFATDRRVFFIEEAVHDADLPVLKVEQPVDNVFVLTPHLQAGKGSANDINVQKELLAEFASTHRVVEHIAWYYTPIALALSDSFAPAQVIVYDCMDELSAFMNAPAELIQKEAELMKLADIVFTGGNSLYQVKKTMHHNVHSCPSSIDKEHFTIARGRLPQPADQDSIPHPRLGFFGVIDERLDIELLDAIAAERPEWQLVLIGPVVKIDPEKLPNRPNIHYLGSKSYAELPVYLSGWDVALLPFAKNAATRYISPTKTPEYLAGGKPVVSTSIADVVDPYGLEELVSIADESLDFVYRIAEHLYTVKKTSWLIKVDSFLADLSWDKTWAAMMLEINKILKEEQDVLFSSKKLDYV
ncbi:MAG: glycosyl transferase [Citrobacter freundii]|nr:MAG: glycosyl transferase [Citrobacter freundii]